MTYTNDNYRKLRGSMFGVAVADALGVPFEGISRREIKENPCDKMEGYGTHYQPAGTWSDDSSLTFCLAESLCNGLDYRDIAQKFVKWRTEAYWSARGKVFDIGNCTSAALERLSEGVEPILAGVNEEFANGNGSLMRISPLIFYLHDSSDIDISRIVGEVCGITHGHVRSKLACEFYVRMGINLLQRQFKSGCIQQNPRFLSKTVSSRRCK